MENTPRLVLDDDAPTSETAFLPRFFRTLLELLIAIGVALAVAGALRQGVVQPYFIPTPSMSPTIHPGDRVLVNKLQYEFARPHRGDIVVFPDPAKDGQLLIKRIVAVGGDIIDARKGKLVVNGDPVPERYTKGRPTEPGPAEFPMMIPQGYVFLMGDNRTDSHDSRWFGPQPVSGLRGRAFALYWPLEHLSEF